MDNFSGGYRGAASAEYFLDHGYAVIFIHRLKSLEPFTRHFNGQKFMDMLELNEKGPNTTVTGEFYLSDLLNFPVQVRCYISDTR